ncbi:conserved Plasmodium protein, unknown function [Plasmodium ovale]|uniref:Uncharacterized protein n=1 Tax=Plasmodium ovale TaxID=36330 RepID=A0A1C3KU34_PLAOA|nr:conserved Plasmodium protein, unknown function [Plasmodium ovale]
MKVKLQIGSGLGIFRGSIHLFPPFSIFSAVKNYSREMRGQSVLEEKMRFITKCTLSHEVSNNVCHGGVIKKVSAVCGSGGGGMYGGDEEKGENVPRKDCTFFENDKLFYNNIVCKLARRKKKPAYISSDFFYHLNKFHINFINNNFNFFFLKFTKTCKIFFAVLFSFSLFLTIFLVTSSNYLEFNIILKYHIKFHSLLFSFFSSYYLGLQVGNYYLRNNLHYLYTLLFLMSSILSTFIADYNIWTSYCFLNSNYLLFLAINCYNMSLKRFPTYVFKNVNRIILFSLFSSYLAVNKGKYIEKNIESLKDENCDLSSLGLFKIMPYFL